MTSQGLKSHARCRNSLRRIKGIFLWFTFFTVERSLYSLSTRGGATVPEGQKNELHPLTIGEDGPLAETLAPIRYSSPNDTRP